MGGGEGLFWKISKYKQLFQDVIPKYTLCIDEPCFVSYGELSMLSVKLFLVCVLCLLFIEHVLN